MGLCITMGAVWLLGYQLNPANMIAFPILVGVGIDNAVHVIHDFLGRDRSKQYALKSSTFKGIFVAGLTTVLGFGSLTISSHLGLSSLGLLLALGVSACMICSILWLPSLLQLAPIKVKSNKNLIARTINKAA
jgi:predicted RND superfamily exporter protein